jgi:hypothetical protein
MRKSLPKVLVDHLWFVGNTISGCLAAMNGEADCDMSSQLAGHKTPVQAGVDDERCEL